MTVAAVVVEVVVVVVNFGTGGRKVSLPYLKVIKLGRKDSNKIRFAGTGWSDIAAFPFGHKHVTSFLVVAGSHNCKENNIFSAATSFYHLQSINPGADRCLLPWVHTNVGS